MPKHTAFALAGLGGFNAHGAGFLQAARETGYRPALITATSGQITVVANFLDPERQDVSLSDGLVDTARERDMFAQMETVFFGYPGIFRPAFPEAFARFFEPWTLEIGAHRPPAWLWPLDPLADRFAPVQQCVPLRTEKDIERLKRLFNADSHLGGDQIGIVFNAYDPVNGKGRLYGNETARTLLSGRKSLPVHAGNFVPQANLAIAAKEQQDELGEDGVPTANEEEILPIDEKAIKAALWLTLYGFEQRPEGLIDGAYHRSCILSELHKFERVIVARPLARGWQGRELPTNWFEMQDWQCEMWFSVGYKAEVDAMQRINSMIRKLAEAGTVTPDQLAALDLKRVQLWEVAAETPAGFFHFFIERESVFMDALRKGKDLFAALADEDGRYANAGGAGMAEAAPAVPA